MRAGNGSLDQMFTANGKAMTLSDTTMPCLAIQYSARGQVDELPTVRPHAATITFAVSGGTLVSTVKIKRKSETGADLADLTYVVTGAAAKVDWAAYAASASDIKELVDLLNQIPGIKCWALHIPYGASINNNDYIALAATYIQSGLGLRGYTEVLYRDVSDFVVNTNDEVAYMRVGLPEVRDRDAMYLVEIFGTCTGVTGGTLNVYRDDYDEYAALSGTWATDIAKRDMILTGTLSAANTFGTGYVGVNGILQPLMVRGPVIVEAVSDDLTACNINVMIKQATLVP